jgi:hypothetical protein
MSLPSRRLLAVLVSASFCLAGLAPATAHADGDPASDFLITEGVFVPSDGPFPPDTARRLTELVGAAKTGGYRIKVALIATRYDLGSVTPLWRQPQRYARFLGQELFFVYKGRLLIVMPNGYGIYHGGKPVASERKLLDGVPTPAAAGADVATAAVTAVRRLARASGIDLELPAAPARTAPSRHFERIVIAAGGLAWILFAAVVLLRHRRRRAARAGDRPT